MPGICHRLHPDLCGEGGENQDFLVRMCNLRPGGLLAAAWCRPYGVVEDFRPTPSTRARSDHPGDQSEGDRAPSGEPLSAW